MELEKLRLYFAENDLLKTIADRRASVTHMITLLAGFLGKSNDLTALLEARLNCIEEEPQEEEMPSIVDRTYRLWDKHFGGVNDSNRDEPQHEIAMKAIVQLARANPKMFRVDQDNRVYVVQVKSARLPKEENESVVVEENKDIST